MSVLKVTAVWSCKFSGHRLLVFVTVFYTVAAAVSCSLVSSSTQGRLVIEPAVSQPGPVTHSSSSPHLYPVSSENQEKVLHPISSVYIKDFTSHNTDDYMGYSKISQIYGDLTSQNSVDTPKKRSSFGIEKLSSDKLAVERFDMGLPNSNSMELSSRRHDLLSSSPHRHARQLVQKSAVESCYQHGDCVCLRRAGFVIELRCIGPSVDKVPDGELGRLEVLELLNTRLTRLGSTSLANLSRLSTLRVMSGQLSWIADDSLSHLRSSLTAVDLSFNNLHWLPSNLFSQAGHISWLNLHGNQLTNIDAPLLSPLRHSLSQLFVGENRLHGLPLHLFSQFSRLVWLNVDSNLIHQLEGASMPPTLQTLSANGNMLTEMPLSVMNSCRTLRWLYLEDNSISELPGGALSHALHLHQLSLSRNAISHLPPRPFNGSVRVAQLLLSFNRLQQLPDSFCDALHVTKLALDHNRIVSVHPRAFRGAEHSLYSVDLSYNLLSDLPPALGSLNSLHSLNLAHNCLTSPSLEATALVSLELSVRWLSLAENRLHLFPRRFLAGFKRLAYLDVSYNCFHNVSYGDFTDWAGSLETLVLDSCCISRLSADFLTGATILRELRISFNPIATVDQNSLACVSSTLHVLEMSFALQEKKLAKLELRSLSHLRWLVSDHNAIKRMSVSGLSSHTELLYVNLQHNRLLQVPETLLYGPVRDKLQDLRLDYNLIEHLELASFRKMPKLQSVSLTHNAITHLSGGSFYWLANLSTLLLAHNRIEQADSDCFSNLPLLTTLDLQHNLLSHFSLSSLYNSTRQLTPLSLNLSYNLITELSAPRLPDTSLHVQLLDLRANQLSQLPRELLAALAHSLRHVQLSGNSIGRVRSGDLSSLRLLVSLSLQHNTLATVDRHSFRALGSLCSLDLSHNQLTSLPDRLFSPMKRLTLLDLSHNRLVKLSDRHFLSTSISALYLSDNLLSTFPQLAVSNLRHCLLHLGLAANRLQYMGATALSSLQHTLSVDLSSSGLTVLTDTALSGTRQLLRLNLSFNHLRANFKEVFHYVQQLQELIFSATGLEQVPELPLPNLQMLNLSHNNIRHVKQGAFTTLSRLAVLDLSHNKLFNVPKLAWIDVPGLSYLDISSNEIDVVNGESFRGLEHLTSLKMAPLSQLSRFDSDTLSDLSALQTLEITTCPQIEKYRFRVGGVLSALVSLRSLLVLVREHTLDDQLWGGLGVPKLRRLVVTGPKLQHIHADAFQDVGWRSDFSLTIAGTAVSQLPDDMMRHLAGVWRVSLQLSDNSRLKAVSRSNLFGNSSDMDSTRSIRGGVVLSGRSALLCSCHVTWLAEWLERWLRESAAVHTAPPTRALLLFSQLEQATCQVTRSELRPLVSLVREQMFVCHPHALSTAAGHFSRPLSLSPLAPLLLVLVTTHWGSYSTPSVRLELY